MNNDPDKQDYLGDLLKQEDYQELHHSLLLRNDTSGISFLDYELISIKEFKTDSLCLEIPKNVCQKGHNLTLIFLESPVRTNFKKFPNIDNTDGVPIMGKVIEHLMEEDSVHVEIKFTQYKPLLWQDILKKYEERQKKVSSLIKEVKR